LYDEAMVRAISRVREAKLLLSNSEIYGAFVLILFGYEEIGKAAVLDNESKYSDDDLYDFFYDRESHAKRIKIIQAVYTFDFFNDLPASERLKSQRIDADDLLRRSLDIRHARDRNLSDVKVTQQEIASLIDDLAKFTVVLKKA